MWRSLRTRLLAIDPREVTVARRKFHAPTPAVRERLEAIGQAYLHGYHQALACPEPAALGANLAEVEVELRGFAFEGAALALTLLDHLTPWHRSRWEAFASGPAADYVYLAHVGAGTALARLRRSPGPTLARTDPLLGWLAVDGYGFHDGYFHWERSIQRQLRPRRLRGYQRRVYDQGLGRSLWFVAGTDPERIAAAIGDLPAERRADVWSGIGLACAYAGGATRASVIALQEAAGEADLQLAQGAAFAAKARQRGGNVAVHTEMACDLLCGLSVAEAANVTDEALRDLPMGGPVPGYEVWRVRIRGGVGSRRSRARR
jgi:enediyne biosynthesis protein E3